MERNLAIKAEELTKETYPIYCRMFLTERMYKQVPITSPLNYGHIFTLVNGVEKVLFEQLNTETGKLLLTNRLYSMVMALTGEEFSREFLYGLVEEIASCMPDMEDHDLDELKELIKRDAEITYDY